jgi:hypothetical protein
MNSWLINKNVCFQFRLRKIVGKKIARRITINIEKAIVAIFGREVGSYES